MTISGPTPDKPTHESNFRESVELFEKSFQELQSSKLPPQREEYVKIMKESLSTMQESANAMVNSKLVHLKENLSKDLNEYLDSPTDDHLTKVQQDISTIKSEES